MQKSSLLDMYCISSCYSFLIHTPWSILRATTRRSNSGPPPKGSRSRTSDKCSSREDFDSLSTTSTEEENDSLRRVSMLGKARGSVERNPIIQLNGCDELKNFERCEVSPEAN
ncbi:hypothetical protein L596_028015 [Steinernema carpocapsae]|uniref:Uncharacterized protein n=1 Tax=Steinernema carpocapsae TaxID=34508 RepID=A0A4U5LX71_STECR|nr:hypothetical protein L596_028015 [Steinernema carpocapsae]